MHFNFSVRVEVLIIIAIVWWLLWAHVFCSCSQIGLKEAFTVTKEAITNKLKKEGFVGANTNNGQSSPYELTKNGVNTDSWFQKTLQYNPNATGKVPGVQEILNRKEQPIPLPEGELSMFASTPFSPKCCPNAFSNSMGCACMTVNQYKYLHNRGGNNVPFSEY